MPKRQSDTDKWTAPWFRALPGAHKLLWFYVYERCDLAGFFVRDEALDSVLLNIQAGVAWPKFFDAIKDRVLPLDKDLFWIRSFISEQYGVLKRSCPSHRPVIERLESMLPAELFSEIRIDDAAKVLHRSRKQVAKDLASRRGASSVKTKAKFEAPTFEQVKDLCAQRGGEYLKIDIEQFLAHYEANGWVQASGRPIRSWPHALVTWMKNQGKFGPRLSQQFLPVAVSKTPSVDETMAWLNSKPKGKIGLKKRVAN